MSAKKQTALQVAMSLREKAEKTFDSNRDVWNLHAAAMNNATETVGFLKEESGEWFDMYLASVRDLLSSRDTPAKVKAWFAARGVIA